MRNTNNSDSDPLVIVIHYVLIILPFCCFPEPVDDRMAEFIDVQNERGSAAHVNSAEVDAWEDVDAGHIEEHKTPEKSRKRGRQPKPVKFTPGSTPKKKKAKPKVSINKSWAMN